MMDWMPATVALGMVAGLIVIVWRFTSVVSRMATFSERLSERNQLQRDRMVGVFIEKMMAYGDDDKTVPLANLHASENRSALAQHLDRDAVTDRTRAKNQRTARRMKERREEEAAGLANASEQDAMT